MLIKLHVYVMILLSSLTPCMVCVVARLAKIDQFASNLRKISHGQQVPGPPPGSSIHKGRWCAPACCLKNLFISLGSMTTI